MNNKLNWAIAGAAGLLIIATAVLAGVLFVRVWPGWHMINRFGPTHGAPLLATPAPVKPTIWSGSGPDVITYESRRAGPAVFTLLSDGWTGFTLSDSFGQKIAILGHGEFPESNMAKAVEPLGVGVYYINIEQPTGISTWGVQIER